MGHSSIKLGYYCFVDAILTRFWANGGDLPYTPGNPGGLHEGMDSKLARSRAGPVEVIPSSQSVAKRHSGPAWPLFGPICDCFGAQDSLFRARSSRGGAFPPAKSPRLDSGYITKRFSDRINPTPCGISATALARKDHWPGFLPRFGPRTLLALPLLCVSPGPRTGQRLCQPTAVQVSGAGIHSGGFYEPGRA